jgi:2-acylglycerol O-acyltransferase 2
VYYSATGFGGAEHTGQREWPAFQEWLGDEAERVLPAWLGSFEVVLDAGGAEFPADKRYIFGYAPHGLYPLGAAYLPLTPSFRRLLPGVRPATLTASVVFQLPLLRDILCWAGCRAVSRATFSRALRERGAVLVVPGGQAELVEAHRMVPTGGRPAECAVYTRHRGFVRVAAREGAALVPVVALGEVSSLSNVVSLPALQRWTYRRLGFPVPFLLAGWLRVTPLPAKTGLRYVVGCPIDPPQLAPGEEPSDAQVEALHSAFYDEVERLFLRHRKTFPGYKNIPLVKV